MTHYIDDSDQFVPFVPWDTLPSKEKQIKINKSRNYLRYKVIKGLMIDPGHQLLTPEERELVIWMNDTMSALKAARIGFYNSFYENCPRVGSTLKRKVKPKQDLVNDILGDLDTI